MLHHQEEILLELGTTLDQLIQNAELLKPVNLRILDDTEIDYLHKTQESLTAKFFHTKEHLTSKKTKRHKQIEDQFLKLQSLDVHFLEDFSGKLKKNLSIELPKIGRNRRNTKKPRACA